MTAASRARLFDPTSAFDHPATLPLVGVVAVALAVPPAVLATGLVPPAVRADVWKRYLPWLAMAPLIGLPVLLGAFWAVLAVGLLAVLGFREYSRVTGLFRETGVTALTYVCIAAVYLAAVDHWKELFFALPALGVAAIAAFAVPADRPKGYVQRVALAVFGFALLGPGLGHLAFLANDTDYRPRVLLVVVAVELNDVAAYTSGRLFGRRKLCPATSPNKTVGGAIGAVAGTTLFVVVAGRWVFAGTPLDHAGRLAVLGALVSVSGQLGDLILSSVKRDVGVKDTAAVIPGHGGLLDRFDSLLTAAPVAFHWINYWAGVGLGQPGCVFTAAR